MAEGDAPLLLTVLLHLLHLGGVDPQVAQQLLAAMQDVRRQGGRARQDPAVVQVEDAQHVGAGVHHRVAVVVGGQNPGGVEGGDWGDQRDRK